MKKYFIFLTVSFSLFAAQASLPTSAQTTESRSDIYAQCKAQSKNITEYRTCKEKKLGEYKVVEQMRSKLGEYGTSVDENKMDSAFSRKRDAIVDRMDMSIKRTTFLRNCIAAATDEKEISDCKKVQDVDFGKIDVQNYGKESQSQQNKLPEKTQPRNTTNKLPLPPVGLGI